MAISQAKREANARYDEKTYTQVNARLRKEEDADLIASYKAARANDLHGREWIRGLFEGGGGFDTGELIRQVESLRQTCWENSDDQYYAGATMAYDNVLQIIKELNTDR